MNILNADPQKVDFFEQLSKKSKTFRDENLHVIFNKYLQYYKSNVSFF